MTVKERFTRGIWRSGILLAFTLGACSSGGAEQGTGAVSTTTRPVVTGHADAIIPTTEAVPEALAFGVELWIEMGATNEQARCYAAMFAAEGWDPQTAEDIASLQLTFTDAQSEEFASC